MDVEHKNWGGAREGAGAKSKWKSKGGTKLVRVPMAIESEVLEAARAIDAGVALVPAPEQQETVTQSNQQETVTQSSVTPLWQWCVFYRHHDGRVAFRGGYSTEYEANAKVTKFKRDEHDYASIGDHPYIPPGTYEIRRELVAPIQQEIVTESSNRIKQLEAELQQLKANNDQLCYENSQLDKELNLVHGKNGDLNLENTSLKEQLTSCIADSQTRQQLPDLEATRDRFLASLRLGKQAPEYKRTKTVLDRFIAFDRSE